MHSLPASNYVDHGFYMFSPTLLWDYYSANRWQIKDALFFRHPRDPEAGRWRIYNYLPRSLDKASYSGLKGIYAVVFIVKKTAESTFGASVQQGFYLESWRGREGAGAAGSKGLKKRLTVLLPKRLKGILRPLYYYILSKIPLSFYLRKIDWHEERL